MARQARVARSAKSQQAADYPELLQALAAFGRPLGRAAILDFGRHLGLLAPDGQAWTGNNLNAFVNQCVSRGYLESVPQGFICGAAHRFAALKVATAGGQLTKWCDALFRELRLIERRPYEYGSVPIDNVVAGLRIALYAHRGDYAQVVLKWLQNYSPGQIYSSAFEDYIDNDAVESLDERYRDDIVGHLLHGALHHPRPNVVHLTEWALPRLTAGTATPLLRYSALKQLVWSGRYEECNALLSGDQSQHALFLRADAAALQGNHSDALHLYDQGLAVARRATKAKYGLMPLTSGWLRIACLIVSGDPAQLKTAASVCRGEAKASTSKWLWNSLQQIIDVRAGDAAAESQWLTIGGNDMFADLTQALGHAWLRKRFDQHSRAIVENWIETAAQTGYRWVEAEFRASLAIAGGGQGATSDAPPSLPATPHAAVPSMAAAFSEEATWQHALAAIAALAGGTADQEREETRIAWVIDLLDVGLDSGRPLSIEPWEQKYSARGWSRGKRLPLSRLARNEDLTPQDARVCQGIQRVSSSTYALDPHRALRALVGHPLVYFLDDLETPVELVAAEPELLISRESDDTRLTLLPNAAQIVAAFDGGVAFGKADANPCLLVRQSATRAHVVALDATHRRIAKMIGGGLTVPAAGVEQLRHAIAGAAQHFTVHSELAGNAETVPGDSTVHAQLSPRGTGLRLRLAVKPFGERGPHYGPGRGSARVFAKLGGESQAVLRDLQKETEALEEVLSALELFGVDTDTLEAECDDPASCLSLIETLQGLGDKVRVDWPAGIKFRVSRVYGAGDMKVALTRRHDWFMADGGLTLDDGTVLSLRRLIESARKGHGRFLPLGDGGFVALSEDLRRRMDELALLDESDEGAAKLPAAAALAVAEITEQLPLQSGKDWSDILARIQEAEALDPEPPSTLQAELRPYQRDGFRWLARLAHWGGGACLADDMGLGKTVQALAVLLQRAPQGPALVIAPTSVCQNWIDEANRFAPTLNARLFGGPDRTAMIEKAGSFEVLICSYTLLQQEIAAFAERRWHSLVLDEAQAVKNFATKRAQAVLSLKADFRLAATGTPVENRLEELWMLFRFLNPGLLGSRERFNARFAAPIERSGSGEVRAHLRRFVSPFILRRTKSEVLTELPPRTEIVLSVEPEPDEQAFHEALRQSALAALADSTQPLQRRRFQVLSELMRVRRACCDPRLVMPDSPVRGAKLEAFAELAQELIANRHKALVFSQFVDYLSLLRARLDELGIRYQYLDGSTPAAERVTRVKAFQAGDGDLFLISLRAGGVGLNLTAADYVIITDPWWNPAVEDQAASRAHRMGQERPVTVYRLVVKNSIEERIMNLHGAKRALAEGLFGGDEFGGAWTAEDLVALLRQ